MRAGRRQVWLAASVAGGVLVAALGVWALFFRSDSSRSIRRSVPIASLPAGRRPADLKVALLFDCYEHALENVPPRWDTSSRQRNWKAPPPPLPLLRSALNGSEPKLLSWMQAWDEQLRKGTQTVPQELPELEGLLRETALPCDVLFKVGLAVSFLDGDAHAACWLRTAISRAEQRYGKTGVRDAAAGGLLDFMSATAVLWRERDYRSLQRRFALERSLYPPYSAESRRAGHLLAECYYSQVRIAEAADMINVVAGEHQHGRDLSPSDEYEFNWVRGVLLVSAKRHSEALEPIRSCVARRGEHDQGAIATLVAIYAEMGRTDLALEQLRTLTSRYGASELALSLARQIQEKANKTR